MNLIVTFIYEDVCRYLPQWIDNINSQTANNFEVVIFSDQVSNPGQYFLKLACPFQIVEVLGSVVENRFKAIEILKDSAADNIIFQDADDLMSDNRVGICEKYLQNADVVANDLTLISEDGKLLQDLVWTERLENGFEFNHNFILNWNIVGLGNTAIRRKLLLQKIDRPDRELIAADWFIFYQLMEKSGAKAVFTNECWTLYRQHASNIAGINLISADKLARAIKIKQAHFAALNSIGYDFNREISDLYKINPTNGPTAEDDTKKPLFWWEETELYEKN